VTKTKSFSPTENSFFRRLPLLPRAAGHRRAKDQYVWDAGGHQYLDSFGASSHTVRVGRSNDEVNAKVHRQLDTLQRVSTLFATGPQAAIRKGDRVVHAGRGSSPGRGLPMVAPRPTKPLSCRHLVSRETPRSCRSATFLMAAPPPAMTLTEARGGSACRRPASCTPLNAYRYRCPASPIPRAK
jgi:hypothetical protein